MDVGGEFQYRSIIKYVRRERRAERREQIGARVILMCSESAEKRSDDYCRVGGQIGFRECVGRDERTQFVRAGYVPAGLFHLSIVPADRINGAAAAHQSG